MSLHRLARIFPKPRYAGCLISSRNIPSRNAVSPPKFSRNLFGGRNGRPRHDTLSERILGAAAGEYVDRKVNRAYAHDGTGVLALEAWKNMGGDRLGKDTDYHIQFDHIAPANNSTTATLQHDLRGFAKRASMQFSDIGCGICHQLMGEGVVLPGEIVVGADSHSVTLGAFGAFATGVGATDMASIWLTGETWFRVPESIGIHLTGRFTGAAEAKDLALAYVGKLGTDGATYQALEFVGEGAHYLSMDERLVLSNLSVEAGSKAGLFYADDVTIRFLKEHGHDVASQEAASCTYRQEVDFDLSDVVPLVAIPHRVDTIKPVDAVAGVPIDQVFVGTCTNGRYSDLARFARIVKGKESSYKDNCCTGIGNNSGKGNPEPGCSLISSGPGVR